MRLAVLLIALLATSGAASAANASLIAYVLDVGAPPPFATNSLPVTLFDNATLASDAPEGNPASASAHFQEFRNLLTARENAGTKFPLTLEADLQGHMLVVNDNAPANLTVKRVLVEDALKPRFIARAVTNASTFALDPAWNHQRLGVVLIVSDPATGEVLNSATWLAGQAGPTVQTTKAVLVEHATATWCDPCAASDSAYDLLASQTGHPPPTSAGRSYWVEPGALAFIGLAVGLAVGILLWRRAS